MINAVKTILLLMLLFSCDESSDNRETANSALSDTSANFNNHSKGEYSNSKLNEYREYVSQLDSLDAESSAMAVKKYNTLFAGQTVIFCDSAFLFFNRLYESLDRNLNRKHQDDTTNYDPLVYLHEKGNEPKIAQKLIDYKNRLKENGFEVSMDEGMTFIQQDRDFISIHFYSSISNSMKEYLEQLNKENKEGFSTDGGMIITPTQLVERIIWFEKFMTANPRFIFWAKCHELKTGYLSILLTGMDNSPLYDDFETRNLSQQYADGYQHLLSKYPNSQTAEIVRPYFFVLKERQTAKAEDLLERYKQAGIIY